MSLDKNELDLLEEHIMEKLPSKMVEILIKLNRENKIEDLLDLIEMRNLIPASQKTDSYKTGKIVIIGETRVKEKELLAIANKLGLAKDRFEFCTEYEKAVKFEYKKMEYNPKYRIVLLGPIPHSCKNKGEYSSIITMLEQSSAYPRTKRLSNGNTLKITKSGFKKSLQELINENYI
jgi:hypothetical protein